MEHQPIPSLDEVIAYIHGDPERGMIADAGSEHVAALRALWKQWQPDNLIPGRYGLDIGRAIRRFAILTWPEEHRGALKRYILDPSDDEVAYASRWARKAEIQRRFGEWSHDAAADRSYRADVWSNLHYGYVGTAAGMPERLLRSGGGVAHLISGKIPPGYLERLAERLLDVEFFPVLGDAVVQAAIQLGVNLWKRQGATLEREELLAAVRAASGLATQPGLAAGDDV